MAANWHPVTHGAGLGCQLCPFFLNTQDLCTGELWEKASCWYEFNKAAREGWERDKYWHCFLYDNGYYATDGGPGYEVLKEACLI